MVVLPPQDPVDETSQYNQNYILYWNNVALDLNRLTVTLSGPQNGPPSAARALSVLHLAIHDAYFSIHPNSAGTYLDPNASDATLRLPARGDAGDARQAVAGASIAVLSYYYTRPDPTIATVTTAQLTQFLTQQSSAFPNLQTLTSSYAFGTAVGNAMTSLLGPANFTQGQYRPTPGPYKFNDDPTNPIRIVPLDPNNPTGPTEAIRVYQAPFYGMTARRIGVHGSINGQSTEHILADPPGINASEIKQYNASVRAVVAEGGATTLNTTHRRPDQMVTALTWAYDGALLIGTPPRFFNQCLRNIAFSRRPNANTTAEANNADFARLFAVCNAALGDAGIFAWLGKYCYEFWRPLTGVREGTGPYTDPFWLTLGSPDTNTNEPPFKPPFPSYPSGHATFGGALFQAARLYYKSRDHLTFADDAPDSISFRVVSDELNGISRDLRQPFNPNLAITDQQGTVRTRVVRHFNSLWDAIFDNAISRHYLGVHWQFDAFAQADVLESLELGADGTSQYKSPSDIRYVTTGSRKDRPGSFPIGGVPLGIGIATDIFQSGLKPSPASVQPDGRSKCSANDAELVVQSSWDAVDANGLNGDL